MNSRNCRRRIMDGIIENIEEAIRERDRRAEALAKLQARYSRLESWVRARGGNVLAITRAAGPDYAKPAVQLPDDRKRVARVIEGMEEHQITPGAGPFKIDGCDVASVLNVLNSFAKPVGVVIGNKVLTSTQDEWEGGPR